MSDDYEEDPWKGFQQFSESEQQTVQAIKGVEAQQQEIRYQYQLELLTLQKKYARLQDPLYDRRANLIAGNARPEGMELEAGGQGLRRVFGKEIFQPPSRRSLPKNGVENFWLAVIMSHPGLSLVVAQRDQEALKYLADIRCTYFTPETTGKTQTIPSYASIASGETGALTISPGNRNAGYGSEKEDDIGYKLSFHFRANPYFSDSVLNKTYIYKKGQVDEFGDLLYEKAIGSQIYWKPGMDLTDANYSNENVEGPPVSFFTFFSPKEMPPGSEVEKLSDEEYTALLDEVEGDFECGEDIRDELIPYALTYLVDPPSYDDDDGEDGESGESGDDGDADNNNLSD